MAACEPAWTCKERYTQSERAWLEALGHGCLSKALNDKDQLYSHFRALSGRQVGRSNLSTGWSPEAERVTGTNFGLEVTEEETRQLWEKEEEYADNFEGGKKGFQPAPASPVILEDLSCPPAAIEDVDPALFTVHEFLRYVRSPEWPDTIRLRVVGGELLSALNIALVNLEKRRLINFHSLYAFANNRVKSAAGQEVGEQSAAKEGEEKAEAEPITEPPAPEAKGKGKATGKKQKFAEVLESESEKIQATSEPENVVVEEGPTKKFAWPKGYQTDPEWEYEKLSLEIVFYEKGAQSNIPYIVPNFDGFDYFEELPIPKLLPRSLVREPNSYKAYRIDAARLPPYENISEKERIVALEQEIVELKNRQEQLEEEGRTKAALMDKNKTQGKDMGKRDERRSSLVEEASVDSKLLKLDIPSVEYVADDPHLVPEKPLEKAADVSRKANDRRGSKAMKDSKKTSQSSGLASEGGLGSRQASIPPSLPSLAASDKQVDVQPSQIRSYAASDQSLDRTLMNVSGSESGSFSSLGSVGDSQEDLEDDEEVPGLQQLRGLTREELYVSSLYAPREENRRETAAKLETLRRARARLQAQTARRVMEAAAKRAKGDLYSNFKHLAKKREAERIRATRPQVRRQRWPTQRGATATPTRGRQQDISQVTTGPAHLIPGKQTQTCVKPFLHNSVKAPAQATAHTPLKPLPPISHQPPSLRQKGKHTCETSRYPGALTNIDTAHSWELYRKDQDTSEKEAALKNDLETGVLERMPTRNFHPNYTTNENLTPLKDKTKAKGDRNKSQNKKHNVNENRVSQNSQRNNSTQRKYPAYNLLLSVYGQTMKITQPDLKSNIIQSSFCVDQNGTPQEWQRKPSVRRIGFRSPDQLIQYLVSVRRAVARKQSPASWHPVRPNEIHRRPGMGLLENYHRRNISNWSSLSRPPVHWAHRDVNNSGIRPEKQRQSKLSLLKSILKVPEAHRNLDQPFSHFRQPDRAILDENKSAVSSTSFKSEEDRSVAGEAVLNEEPETPEAGAEARKRDTPEEGGEEEQEEIEEYEVTEVALTASELLERDLQCYGEACSCHECEGQSEILADLKPTGHVFTQITGCPPMLGRLRRDFHFLQRAGRGEPGARDKRDPLTGRVRLPERLPVLSAVRIGEELLELMNDVMIRKEILCSSRDFTYITVTFTKRRDKDDSAEKLDREREEVAV